MRRLQRCFALVMSGAQGLEVGLVVSAAEGSRDDVIDVGRSVVALVDSAGIMLAQVAKAKALPG
jgi:hypothetical protein